MPLDTTLLGKHFKYTISASTAILLTLSVLLFASPQVNGAAPVEEDQGAKTDLFGNALDPSKGPFAAGFEVYQQHCASCHAIGGERIPHMTSLRDMTPKTIYTALIEGTMRPQAETLSAEQKKAVAEFIANREMGAETEVGLTHRCSSELATFDPNATPPFTNWGLAPGSSHFIPGEVAGLNRSNVGKLKLKWAYAFPNSQRLRSQPAIAGGAIILGNHTGSVRALDLETGCERWSFEAAAEVRTAVIVSSWEAGDSDARPLAYFGDLRGNVYGIDARNGALVWKVLADDHPAAVITGAPTLHEDTLYVPVSSLEEAAAASPGYICCSFRGSVLALDAATGAEKWRTYMVDQQAVSQNEDQSRWGPSGVAVWNSPTIDAKRGQLYFATGDNYSNPTTDLSDAVVALDLKTGEINWHYQALEGDAWNVACIIRASGNCPEDEGPDFDFGSGTILATDKNGRELVLAGQKSGIAYGIDPDTGKKIWQTRVGRGGAAGGIVFGMAANNGRLFVPMFDMGPDLNARFPASPGLYALDIGSGEFLWRSPAANTCNGKRGCVPGTSGSISTTPELVLAGSDDGHLRIHDAETGAVLWDKDTTVDFETVNGVAGHGGAISGGAAPIAYKGKLIVASGYGFASRMAGNVLLVFEAE